MKNFLVALLLSLAVPVVATAQLGLKAGLGAAKSEVDDISGEWDSDGVTTSIHAGLFGRINVSRLYLQPEVYYTFTEANFARDGVTTEKIEMDFHRLDVPVLLGYRLSNTFRINAGPFASVFINTAGKEDSENVEGKLRDYYESSSFGWQAGLGADVGRFVFDLRYETTVGNLRNFDFENSTTQDYLPDEQKQQQWLFSVGYKLGKK